MANVAPLRQFGRKYKDDEFAAYYAGKHDGSLTRRISNYCERAMMRRSLQRIARRAPFHSVLDCPSGAGRFLPMLAKFGVSAIAIDTAAEMLQQARRFEHLFPDSAAFIAGSAFELPLPDKSVDVVMCARLLHHFAESEKRRKVLQEFVRVARVGVVISYFDACSYRAWKRRRKVARSGRVTGRHAITRDQCKLEAADAGLQLLGHNALLRYHTEITSAAFLIAPTS